MKLYNINLIGQSGQMTNVRLPKTGARSEIATCTNFGREFLRGTGDYHNGWEPITHGQYQELIRTCR